MLVWLELKPHIDRLLRKRISVDYYALWSPGDQRIYVSDIRRALQTSVGAQRRTCIEG
jgi:hypothetical protein